MGVETSRMTLPSPLPKTPVIPAKAGIQSVDSASPMVCRLGSRFRGNDCDGELLCLANDTSTGSSFHPARDVHLLE
jgi:hypothetical protein